MAVSIDVFKKAFAGKVSPDLVSQRDQQVTAALKTFSQAVGSATLDPATSKDFNEQLTGLVQRFAKARKSNHPVKEALTELDDILRMATSGVSKVTQPVVDSARGQSSAGGEPKYATGLDIESEPGADETAAPKTGMAARFDISAVVGKGGKNLEDDVRAVQIALNRRMQAGLPTDGNCSPQTIKSIIEFQTALGQSKPDGRVAPGRGTARALAESGKLGPPPKPPDPLPPPDLGVPALSTAPLVWHGTRRILAHNIKELKKSINQEYANEHPGLLKTIDENVKKIDVILEKLDDRLANTLDLANAATNDEQRTAALQNAKGILTDYIRYVKDEVLIGQIDKNPFGVDTKLSKVITDSLKHMAKSIG